MGVDHVVVLDRLPKRSHSRRPWAPRDNQHRDYPTPEARLEAVKANTNGRGADIVMELVGNAKLMEEGITSFANGGTFVQIGAVPAGQTANISPGQLLKGKRIIGSLMYRPQTLPMLLDILERTQGRVPFDRLVSQSFPLEQVNEAFAAAEWHGHDTEITGCARNFNRDPTAKRAVTAGAPPTRASLAALT